MYRDDGSRDDAAAYGEITPRRRTTYERFGKPMLDRFFGLVVGLLTLPVLLVLVALCRFTFGAPAISRLPHIGRNGIPFNLYKLRTVSAKGHDTRGRRRKLASFLSEWSLDELPQLWNIAFGHMSLVGPRPIPPAAAADLEDWQFQRHEVKPGLTGLWQVEARGDGRTLLENIHYDIQYLDQMSFLTDTRILVRTLTSVILRREGEPVNREASHVRDRVPHLRLTVADLGLWLAALSIGYYVRWDFSWIGLSGQRLLLTFGLAAAIQLTYGLLTGLYRGRWRVGSFEETAWVATGSAVVTASLVLAATLITPLISRGAMAAAGTLHLLGALAARYAARVVHTAQERSIHRRPHRLVIFGAGEAGINAVRTIWTDPQSEFEPVAFLDDDVAKRGTRVFGLTVVGGSGDLSKAARRYGADSLLVASPSAPRHVIDAVAAAGGSAGLSVQVLPPMMDSLSHLLIDHARLGTPQATPYQPSKSPTEGLPRISREREFDLAIIGLGYVGLPAAIEASRVGMRVLGLDIDQGRVDALNAGLSHIEDVSADSVATAIAAGFVATTDSAVLAEADAITISVPTPLRDGLPDLRAVIGATEAVGDYLQPGQLVVLESTTYPGTTDEVLQPILEERSGLKAGEDFFLAFSPERIDPGNPDWGIHNTPKLVGGIGPASTERAAMLYQKFAPVVTMSGPREAEMAKLLENTYRHVNIALVNELAIFCQALGVDIWETIRGAATKPFGFQAFYPGPGVGGHCIPIDPNYLSFRVRQLGEQFRFIELAQEINEHMPEYVAGRAISMLEGAGKAPNQSTVLLVGVAYKPDVSDTHETPATAVARALLAAGVAVEYTDPHVESFEVDERQLLRQIDPIAGAAGADLALIHTIHAEFDVDKIADAASLVLDTRGVADPTKAQRL